MPTETRETSSGIFRMEPAPEKNQHQHSVVVHSSHEKKMAKNKAFMQQIGAVFQTIRQSVQQHSDKRYSTSTISNFRTSPHVMTEPSSNQPIRVNRNASASNY